MGKGTKAGVAYFDGTDGPGKPKKFNGPLSQPGYGAYHATGKSAGGTDSPRNKVVHKRGDGFTAPESGKAGFTPGEGVSKHNGVSVPKRVAKAPK